MVSNAGLGAVYGGYQKARQADNQIESGDIANQQARTGQEADAAWGNAIPVLQQMLQPGASPMPGAGGPPPMGGAGPAPQAPPPGQPSQPMQPAPPEQTMSPQGGGPPVGVYNQGQLNPMDAAAGGQPQALGGPAPPGPQGAPPAAAPQAPQPGAQPQQQAGRLDLHTIMGAVVKANPGAKPAVIAAAVAKALPLMTAQAQMDYKNLMTQFAGIRAQTGATNADTNREYKATRVDQMDRQGDQRDRGLDQKDAREGRLAAQAEIRNDQRHQQLEQQKQALETRIQQGGDRAALSEWRAIVDAQHKRTLEIIQSGKNAIGVMDPAERKTLVDEQNAFYKQQIEQMRKGPARPERPAGADTTVAPGKKTEDRPPASGPPGAQGAAPAAARPQAVNPKTGEKVEFDGTKWVPVAAAQPQASM